MFKFLWSTFLNFWNRVLKIQNQIFAVRPDVRTSVIKKVTLPPLTEVGCPAFLEIQNHRGKSNGKKWSQIWKLLLINGVKSPQKKSFLQIFPCKAFFVMFYSSSFTRLQSVSFINIFHFCHCLMGLLHFHFNFHLKSLANIIYNYTLLSTISVPH